MYMRERVTQFQFNEETTISSSRDNTFSAAELGSKQKCDVKMQLLSSIVYLLLHKSFDALTLVICLLAIFKET